MACRETEPFKHKLGREVMSSSDVAGDYVRRMIEHETRGWGDQHNALSRLEARYGLPFWSLRNLKSGRAKTVEAGLFSRIRAAYIDLCERQVTKLQHEITIEKAMNEARQAVSRALNALEDAPVSPEREALEELAKFIVDRKV